MTSIEDGNDIHNKIIAEILKLCTDGCTEQKIMEQTNMSHHANVIDDKVTLLYYYYHLSYLPRFITIIIATGTFVISFRCEPNLT